MNDLKCEDCVHFDPQHKFVNGKKRLVWYGYCSVKSTYPSHEHEGQTFPEGVERVEHGSLATMEIVKRDGVQTHCLQAIKKV